jgi:hypothetical protein
MACRVHLHASGHACSTRSEAVPHEGQAAVHGTWGESGSEKTAWGVLANADLCAQICGLQTIIAGRASGQQLLLWRGWCSFRALFMVVPMYQIEEDRRAQDSRPSSYETYCAGVPGNVPYHTHLNTLSSLPPA